MCSNSKNAFLPGNKNNSNTLHTQQKNSKILKTEFEAKFPEISILNTRLKLITIEATQEHPLFLTKKKIYSILSQPHSFIRLREEFDGNTISYKTKKDPKNLDIRSVKEIETLVKNIDDMEAILLSL